MDYFALDLQGALKMLFDKKGFLKTTSVVPPKKIRFRKISIRIILKFYVLNFVANFKIVSL